MQVLQANQELQDSLIPPSQELVEYIAKLSGQFEEVRARVLKLAESFAIPTPTPEEIFSLKALESLLQNVTEAQKKRAEARRQQALRVLDRVLVITHRDRSDFQPLLDCHAQARLLRRVVTKAQVSDLNPDAKALTEEQHPFWQLLTLIEHQDRLDDDRCTYLQESVAKSFSKPLSVAALRGKLIVSADAVKASSPPAPPAPRHSPQRREPPHGGGSPSYLWQLLREDKLGLAFHLARRLEIHSPDLQPRLPSWLIRALVVGRYMRYDVVSGIVKIMTDFSNSDSCFVNGEDEWNQAVSLLLAASALRPAFLAPNTGASEILYSLRLGSGLNQLQEYCLTIANFGVQLQLLDAIALKKVKEQAAWQQALDDLRQRVEDWYSCEAPRKTMKFAHATYVWRNWLEPGIIIHSLLPLIQEYHRMSSNDYVEQAIQLKQAISNRQQAVLKELNSFEQKNSSVLLLAGIRCCRTAVEGIQDSFRSKRCVTNR